MAFLDVPCLKACRLVSKSWSYEATPKLSRKAVTRLDLRKPHLPDYPFVCQNIRVVVDASPKDANLSVFLNRFGPQIAKLTIYSALNLRMWVQHAPNLTSLQLQRVDWGQFFPKDEPPFSQIKDLSFCTATSSHSRPAPISDQVIHYFPSLHSLSLQDDDWTSGGTFVEEMLQGGALQGEIWSPYLHKLEISSRRGACMKLKLFLNLRRKWKTLRMGGVLLEGGRDVEKFQKFLHRNKETLQELEFQIRCSEKIQTCLVLPNLPKLRRLEIQFFQGSPKIEKFLYSQKFPVLEHISYEHGEEGCRHCLQIFLGDETQVCKTVKTLTVKLHGLNVAEELPNLAKLFPMSVVLG